MKLKPLQVKAAGEHYVTAEIHRRGAYGSPFAGNVPHWDIVAMDAEHKRHIDIQVKTKNHPGRWAASTRDGRVHPELRVDEHQFWVLVDLSKDAPEYYVVPAWWMEHHIFTAYEAYLPSTAARGRGKTRRAPTGRSSRTRSSSGGTAGTFWGSSPTDQLGCRSPPLKPGSNYRDKPPKCADTGRNRPKTVINSPEGDTAAFSGPAIPRVARFAPLPGRDPARCWLTRPASRERCLSRSVPRRPGSVLSLLALLGPALRLKAIPVVPHLMASGAGLDDTASQLQQQLLGGGMG
jgi:hypothetical protein